MSLCALAVSRLVEKLGSEDDLDFEDELGFVDDHIVWPDSHRLRPWRIWCL